MSEEELLRVQIAHLKEALEAEKLRSAELQAEVDAWREHDRCKDCGGIHATSLCPTAF